LGRGPCRVRQGGDGDSAADARRRARRLGVFRLAARRASADSHRPTSSTSASTRNTRPKKWPDDYWPKSPAPPKGAWSQAITSFRRDRKAFQRLAANTSIELVAAIPHGTDQTYLREILLAADHTSYHVGQIVALRRQLGIWK
jgi:hypothetical protein